MIAGSLFLPEGTCALLLAGAAVRQPGKDADDGRAENDDGEGNGEKEDRDEGDARKPDHGPGLERALADTEHRFEHDGKHSSLEAKEKRGNDR